MSCIISSNDVSWNDFGLLSKDAMGRFYLFQDLQRGNNLRS